jgi:dUTP pyrophosphatase
VEEVTLQVLRDPGCEDLDPPGYQSETASGMDVRAAVSTPLTLQPGETALVPTGLRVAVPPGYEIQVRPRSGLALKNGITIPNSPGTIDADYRGPVGVILLNAGGAPFTIRRGDRIAQLVVAPVVHARVALVETLAETERGEGGFGSSGVE